jgi:hypothetical protein
VITDHGKPDKRFSRMSAALAKEEAAAPRGRIRETKADVQQ